MIEEEQPSIRSYDGANDPRAPLLVVALGASAGGLDALREFLAALDDGAGMAFVVIEHMDPASKSLLPTLLMQFTSLPVSEIKEGQAIQGDHVFVAPANAIVEFDAATFRARPMDDSAARRTPIDAAFRSLAASFGPRAVAIVLSGTGSDGTVGVQQVANEGGMTIAQEPASARYDSMPRSALATGVIDHVLTPRQMAEELLAYVGHVEHLTREESPATDFDAIHEALPEICDLLQKATDHNFKHYKTSTLVRRIQRRMQVLRTDDVRAYVDRLRGEPDELTQLFRELLIGVTSFFRDSAAFDVLAAEVVRPLIAQHKSDPLRFWVPGCATGEEAYSLAIMVREAQRELPQAPAVQIFATDIDERALSIARQGIYPIGIAEQVSKERLDGFFIKKGKRYQVTKEIRELCLFSPHNLITDPPFSRLDLISCRNLLIYFGPHLQKKLIPLFHYALRPNGFLFLGPSESISGHKELFAPVNGKNRISQRKATAISSSALVANSAGYRGNLRSLEPGADAEPDLHQLTQRILLDEFAPKAVIVTEEGQILSASGEMERYLTVTEGTFQNNVVRLARPGLRVGLRSALSEAIKVRRKVVHDKVSVQVDTGVQRVRLTVQPMPRLGEEAELFLVVFQDLGALLPREDNAEASFNAEADTLIEQLERELSSTREDLEKTIQELEAANEELKSSNEELLSMNEELQSANEELETSKEEIQSTNEALGRAHANLSNLLTSTTIATIFLDDRLAIVSFTPAVANIYNVLPSDIGRPLAHITHRCSQMPLLPEPAALRKAASPQEDDVLAEDGRWYLRRAHPYQTHEGKAEGMVVTFIDVTELKRVEALSRRHERQLQLITDSLPVLISYADAEQRFRFNNLAYERWFGVSRDSMRGRHVCEIMGEAAYQTALPSIQRALAGEAAGYEAALPSRDGTERTIRTEFIPDHGSRGQVRGYVSVTYDVTEERRIARSLSEAKQAAEEASLAKSDFLANMSHEIRTPLTAILGYGELLSAHITDPDNLACLEAIRRNGKHLVEIINDILDLSKIEAGMLRTELVRIAPGAVLRDVADSLRVRAAEKALTLDLVHDGLLPATIESDPTRLRQVLLNLLSNAIKFTERGGVQVTARLLPERRLLEVAVIDSGIGISREQQAALFAPFTQADGSITRRYGGTGLGLAISKRLVELLGGTIAVTSAEGQGSTFTFTVATGPLEDVPLASELASPALPTRPPLSRLTGRHILIVDDRRDMRYLIQTYLEEAGATAQSASDGAAAVEMVREARARSAPFDAIVLDMQMPVMDGFQAAPLLRAAGHTGRIVALTANAMKGDQERCLAAGCDEYMAKPVDRLRLLYVLAHGGQSGKPAGVPEESASGTAKPDGEAGAALRTEAPALNGSPNRSRVLIVDDNLDATEMLAVLLEGHGVEVATARSGAEALERAAAIAPHVVVLDLGLPDVDGYSVLGHLQSLEPMRATRFIALTGRSGREEQERMREAGFHHQLVKPPDFNHLVELIKRGGT
jgi:two-component system, chemotaxis family, CheB/CheR fusion protein